MRADLGRLGERHRLLPPWGGYHARRVVLHAAERAVHQIAHAVHQPHAAGAALGQADLRRLFGDKFRLRRHDRPPGAGLRQLVACPLPLIHIFHTGQHHGLHEPLDQRGLARTHRPDHADIDIAARPRADLMIDLVFHSFPAFQAWIGISSMVLRTLDTSAAISFAFRMASTVAPQSFATSHSSRS